jgi:putative peptidoglycan lipid II flippase
MALNQHEAKDDLIARQVGTVGGGTLLSRVFGLVREQVFAYLFGAGVYTDAFLAAFRIPNLLRDLFAEGALSSAYVPVFSEYLTQRGRESAFRLTSLVINGLLVITALVVIVGIVLAPLIVKLIAPGFGEHPGQTELATTMARIMFPFLILVALAAAVMGTLNCFGRFGPPAVAPTMFNLGMILAGFLICPFFDPPIVGMAIGVLLGGLGQLGLQLPFLKGAGFAYRAILSFRDPGVRRIIALMTPAAIGVGVTQVNIFVNTLLASLLPEGSISYLNYSYRLMHFPLGVFGVAVATVSLPKVSELAASGEREKMLSTYYDSLKLALYLTIPSSLFLILLSFPILKLLYQRGEFTGVDTVAATRALIPYCAGLFAYASVRVTSQVFYAVKNTKTPVAIAAVAVSVNIIMSLILMRQFSYMGLAMATAIAAVVNISLLLYFLNRKIGKIDWSSILPAVGKMALVSLLFSLFLVVASRTAELSNPNFSFAETLIRFVIVSILGLLIFVLFSRILKLQELNRVLYLVKIKR